VPRARSALLGILTLAFAPNYPLPIIGAALLGVGSSVFHPEASRLARLASGGAHGLAQSLFQVGGNFGQALGPLLAAFFILPRGRSSLAWITLAALVGMFVLTALGRWYKKTGYANRTKPDARPRRHGFGSILRPCFRNGRRRRRRARGVVADRTSIEFVYHICSFLPVIGLLTVFLPEVEARVARPA
jgi:MFS family permease